MGYAKSKLSLMLALNFEGSFKDIDGTAVCIIFIKIQNVIQRVIHFLTYIHKLAVDSTTLGPVLKAESNTKAK